MGPYAVIEGKPSKVSVFHLQIPQRISVVGVLVMSDWCQMNMANQAGA